MTGYMPGAAGGPLALPDVARVRCCACGEERPRRRCRRVLLSAGQVARRYGFRCRDCDR